MEKEDKNSGKDRIRNEGQKRVGEAERIIKDGIFVKNEYGQQDETYRIKMQILNNDRTLAKMNKAEHLLLHWDCDLSVQIHSANLLGNDNAKEFPTILTNQTELYWLDMPRCLAKHVNSASFLSTLRGLRIDNGDLKLRNDVVMENLLYLSTGSGNAYFTKENLPSLRSLSCKYHEGLLSELYNYELFDHLSLHTVHNNIFDEINRIRDLYGLQIIRGKLESIQGISSIKSLHAVELDDLPKLTNLDDLTELPDLAYLEVGYCKHIKDWDFLLELKKLKVLYIIASSYKDYPPQQVLDTLREKGIKAPLKGA